MMFLSTPAQVPMEKDPIALALVLVILAAFAVYALCRNAKRKQKAAAPAPVEAAPMEMPPAPGSAGRLKLHNVEPKTAAMLMAIVADKLQKPLNELRFISIKEVE